MAVGYSTENFGAFADLWTGSQWAPPGNISTAGQSQLAGVSCPTPSDCWAVGSQYDQAHTTISNLIEHWNGTAWSVSG